MTYTAKLVRGTKSINLAAGGYRLGMDFIPPAVTEIPQTAGGTSANRTGGAVLTGRKAANAPFGFSLLVQGSSAAHVRGLVDRVDAFLRQAGDESNPTYLEWKPDNNAPEPLWGQFGAHRRLEIVSGSASYPQGYMGSDLRARGLVGVPVSLEVKPYAKGRPQRLALATGGILEDIIGSPDGMPRGTIIPEATTNLSTNPVFGNSTYDTNWSVGADATKEQNTDKEYVLWGLNSCRYTRVASVAYSLYQTLTLAASSHTISFYVKRPDGGEVTVSHAQIIYNTGQTTAYRAIGGGWYLLTATVTGTGASGTVGLAANSVGIVLYVAGMQVEAKAYPTPLAYGDMLGCAWSGTVHASTSTRTAAVCKIPGANSLRKGQGGFRVVWKAGSSNTQVAANAYLFDVTGTGFKLFWDNANTRWRFEDGTNVAAGTSNSFVAGTTYIFHIVYGPSGLTLYLNGASIGTNGTFTPLAATPAYLFLGSTNAGASYINGTFLDFSTFDEALTTAQVLADYTNITAQASGGDGLGQRVGGVPWHWTYGGDDVVHNYTDATHADYSWIGGVDGSWSAEITGYIIAGGANYGVAISNLYSKVGLPGKNQVSPTTDYFVNSSGTAWAGALGGSVEARSVSTSGTIWLNSQLDIRPPYSDDLSDANYYLKTAIADSGTALYLRVQENASSAYTEWKQYGIGTALVALYLGPANVPQTPMTDGLQYKSYNEPSFYVGAKRGSGTASAYMDYVRIMPGDFMYIELTNSSALLAGDAIYDTSTSRTLPRNRLTIYGRRITLWPGLNYLTYGLDQAGVAPVTSRTITLEWYVTPAWTIA